MKIQRNINISSYTTFRIPALAPYFCVIENLPDLKKAIKFANEKSLKIFVLGGGSNIVIQNLEKKLVIKNEIKGIEDLGLNLFFVGAGEIWDNFVNYTVQRGLCSLAPLSLIPGTVGGAPIQNIGAYGSEVGQFIKEIQVFDRVSGEIVTLLNKDCDFAYRDSIFKKNLGRFIVMYILFELNSRLCEVPNYPGVKEKIEDVPSAINIRKAIISIRRSKLPDWNTDYNVGSFFKNPEVSKDTLNNLLINFPNLAWFEMGDKHAKISAGWLIDRAGLKGFRKGNFSVSNKHALVIIHTGEGNFSELNNFIEIIRSKVQEKFNIRLDQEPIVV